MAAMMIKLLFLVSTFTLASSLSCLECPLNLQCDPLPDSKECYPAFAACACCKTCAGRFGDPCTGFSVRCHPDFVCVNEDGVEKDLVQWHEFDFKGICIRKRCPEPSTDDNDIGPFILGK